LFDADHGILLLHLTLFSLVQLFNLILGLANIVISVARYFHLVRDIGIVVTSVAVLIYWEVFCVLYVI